MTDSEKLDFIIAEIQKIEADQAQMKADQAQMKADQAQMKEIQARTQATLDGIISQTIKVLGEGYRMISERLDRADIEAIKHQSDVSVILAKTANEKVDRAIEKLGKSA